MRALCFSRARYRPDRFFLLLYVAQAGHRESHVPPLHEPHQGLPALSFHFFLCLLDILLQSAGLGGRTCAAAAIASEASAASSVSASHSVLSPQDRLPGVERPRERYSYGERHIFVRRRFEDFNADLRRARRLS